jgi:thioredoxin-like negative regulator of GroEL
MFRDREAYERELEAVVAKLEQDLKKLKAEVEGLRDASKTDAIEALQRKLDEGGRHLRKLKAATDDVWKSEKDAVDKAWSWW